MSIEELFQKYDSLIKKLANYYCRRTRSLGIEFDDLYQEGCKAFLDKYKEYDESSNSFSKFILSYLKLYMLRYIKMNSQISLMSLEEIKDTDIFFKKQDENIENVDSRDELMLTSGNVEDIIISNCFAGDYVSSLTYLTEEQKDIVIKILGLYDNDPKTFLDLAGLKGLSSLGIERCYNIAIKKMKIKEKTKLMKNI